MNIFEFINSKDVRDYLLSINYEFSLIDMVFIINNSKRPIKEKISAYIDIFIGITKGIYKDTEIKKRINIGYHKSLRDFLESYVTELKNHINDFYICNNDELYLLYIDNCDYFYFSSNDFDKIDAYIKNDNDYDQYIIKKIKLDSTDVKQITLNKELEVIDFYVNDKYHNPVLDEIDGLWVDISTPFKKGDIVIYNNEPFVLDWIINQKHDKCYYNKKKYGDSTDMIAYGYFIDDNNHIYYECVHNYLDLEYFNDKSDLNKYNMLNHISLFLKDEISLDYLLNYFDYFKNKVSIKKYEHSLWCLNEFELKDK